VGDVDRHVKGLTPHQKEVWVAVANSVLQRGGSEGAAVRQANAAAQRAPEAEKKGKEGRVRESSEVESDLRGRIGESAL
jgi:hypothetical protein